MKNGRVIKGTADENRLSEELKLINNYARRPLTKDEVYIFSVVLCDNDIDRDFERFDTSALYTLAKLYVGKTGVFDHNPKAENQTARIFSCRVERIDGKKTKTGDDYYRLTARAYLPVTEKNKDLIMSIDSGINKEVSVGCAVSKITCSVCGENRRTGTCNHLNGNEYGGNICHSILSEPTDAYEWSFVAIPAQREAGVIKGFKMQSQIQDQREENMESILKRLKNGTEINLSCGESEKLNGYISKLEKLADEGRAYRSELTAEVVRLSLIVQPEISKKIMEDIAEKMTLEQLKTFKNYYGSKMSGCLPVKPQLYGNESEKIMAENKEYNI